MKAFLPSISISLRCLSTQFSIYSRWHVFRAHRKDREISFGSCNKRNEEFCEEEDIKRGKHVAAVLEKKGSWIFISMHLSRFLVESISKNRSTFPEKIFAFSMEGKERMACFCVGSLECWNAWRKAARKPIRLVAFAAYGGGQSYK